ncbi:hypothetical protein PLICRDRAFT_102470 [Plicaturopsis crispa FD-325 SS-3]|nr:hypothetical protein PLICRDRAFT_102470 [Plicaturopsis crispa FD-325 SS-3]
MDIPAALFFHPILPGHENLVAPAYAFLIENQEKNRRILFDLGIPKDFMNLPPAVASRHKPTNFTIDRDVPTQLVDGGIPLETIDAIIWSHTHIDHIGDPSLFPKSTELVVGSGTRDKFFPTYPENPNSTIPQSYVEGRTVTEVSFDSEASINIGEFRAVDYFGDGSLYLLEVPGHITGHISALARVTPTTFIFLGGDVCHHPGQLRPTSTLHTVVPCPGELLSITLPPDYFDEPVDLHARTHPLLCFPKPGTGDTVHEDPPRAAESIGKLAAHFDAQPNVFVVVAHDVSLEGIIDLFPASLNAWKENGWKERGTWAFLDKKNKAFRFDVSPSK